MQTLTRAFVRQDTDGHYQYGWGSGYVAVPENHVYYGAKAEDVPFGGGFINYAGLHSFGEHKGMWVFGFDTIMNHGDEAYPDEASVMAQALKLKAEIDNIPMAIEWLEDDIRFHEQRIAWHREAIAELKQDLLEG